STAAQLRSEDRVVPSQKPGASGSSITGPAGKAFLISDQSAADAPNPTLVTKEWKVPANWISAKPQPGGKSGSVAQDWLIANGVKFAAGASAAFFPENSRLVVRNTQDQLDMVDHIVEVTAGASPAASGAEGGEKAEIVPKSAALAKALKIVLPK